jgi:hypothetical protein
MINDAMVPIVLVPLAFLFVLLIILIVKAPKAGACVVGGLLLLAPMFFWRLAATGAFRHEEAIPLFLVPLAFLFVLLVIVLAKAPKAGIGLVIATAVMGGLGAFFALNVARIAHRPAAHVAPSSQMMKWRESGSSGSAQIRMSDSVLEVRTQTPSAAVEVLGSRPTPPAPPSPPAPIWSEGVEQEFEADVYPSGLAAAKALGRRMTDPIRTVSGDPNAAVKVVLFQENNERSLLATFGRSLEQELPGVRCSIEADLRNIQSGEAGVTLRVVPGHFDVDMVQGGTVTLPNPHESVQIVATAFTGDRRTSAEARFFDKPWVESFGAYASARPGEAFVIARSSGACTSESEANQQSLDDARSRLTEALGRETGCSLAEWGRPPISTVDVLNGGFITDRFVQSFDTTTG